MKYLVTLILSNLITIAGMAQAPQKFSYQSVIYNASNQLLSNQQVGIQISILQGSANGAAVYTESHSPQTNNYGMATLEIGSGTVLSGNFVNIDWANGPYFIKTETDINGGNAYTITSVQQLLSVPYSLFSNNVSSSVSATGDTLFIGAQTYIVPGISAANNSGGQTGVSAHTCSATNVHNPSKTYGTMTDQEGNTYLTIVMGTQEWMAENLKTSTYRNGDAIATNLSDADWQNTINTQLGAWCYYENDSQYECPYGKLYNWYAVTDSRNVCPEGWHVPSEDEWSLLINYLDANADGGSNFPNVAGAKLKSAGLQYWSDPNLGASNESGLSVLPGGYRNELGAFNFLGTYSYSWSSTESDPDYGWMRYLSYLNGNAYRNNFYKQYGFSVRCMRD